MLKSANQWPAGAAAQDSNQNISHSAFCILHSASALFLIGLLLVSVAPAFGSTTTTHRAKIKNTTGRPANDFHVVFGRNGHDAHAPPFAPSGSDGTTHDFSGGTVPNGGSIDLDWTDAYDV